MSAPDTDAGRKGGCPRCGQRVRIPAGAPPHRQTVLGKPLSQGKDESTRSGRRRLKTTTVIKVVTGLIGIVTALFVAAPRYYNIQEAAKKAERARLEVENASRPASPSARP
jgi:hypothetical protein